MLGVGGWTRERIDFSIAPQTICKLRFSGHYGRLLSNFSRYIWGEATRRFTGRRTAPMIALVAFFALFSAACNLHADLDSVHYLGAKSDADLAIDSGDRSDGDSGDSRDADSDVSLAPDGGEGDSVEDADVEVGPDNECDILHQEGCDDATACVFDNAAGRTRCVSSEEMAEHGGSGVGDACQGYQDCQVGLICVDWAQPDPRGSVCSRPCNPGAGSLCQSTEFCASSDLVVGEGIGFCTPKCDILNPGATCELTERCVPDPFQPNVAFGANFRCLQNYDGNLADPGAPPKSMSSKCSAMNLHENGCPAELTCLPVRVSGERGEYCLEPCANGDASNCAFFQSLNTCLSIPESPSGTGYCAQ